MIPTSIERCIVMKLKDILDKKIKETGLSVPTDTKPCPVCDEKILVQDFLQHVKSAHSSDAIECIHCNRGPFKGSRGIGAHLRSCKKISQFCNHCGGTFTGKQSKIRHQRCEKINVHLLPMHQSIYF